MSIVRNFQSKYAQMMKPVDSVFRHLEDFFIIAFMLVITLGSAGFLLTKEFGIIFASWRYLLN